MYPVIHPAYRHTLVGRVISLLDYYMKGFLNGGFFDETFIQEWQKTKSHDMEYLKKHCIDIHDYCKKHIGNGSNYVSVREIVDNHKRETSAIAKLAMGGEEKVAKFIKDNNLGEMGKQLFDQVQEKDDPEIFSDYSGFRSSFRIIAKQNSIKKSGNLFQLDGGFDAFYTIEPDPSYEEALEKYRYENGCEPPGYLRLTQAYEYMKHQIQTLMPKLPKFKELFEQLKVINFFCYYLKTLKAAQKVPVFTRKSVDRSLGCAPLFPHLPIRKIRSEKVQVNFGKIYERLPLKERQKLESYLYSQGSEKKPPADVTEAILKLFRKDLQASLKTISLPKEKKFVDEHRKIVIDQLKSQRKEISDLKSRPLTGNEKKRVEEISVKISKGNYDASSKDLELLLRSSFSQPKDDLTSLEKLKKQKEENISKGEARLKECKKEINELLPDAIRRAEAQRNKYLEAIIKTRNGDAEYNLSEQELCLERLKVDKNLTVLDKALRDSKEQKEALEKGIPAAKKALKALEDRIKDARECKEMVKLFSLAGVPHTESKTVVEFYSEQPEEEREENKRIVGGCGLDLKNLPLTTLSAKQSLFSQMVSGLSPKEDEILVPIKPDSEDKAKGYAFRIHIGDFSGTSGKDFQWFSHFYSKEEEELLAKKREFFNTILFEDAELFLARLTQYKNSVADNQGIHAIHHAATRESPLFLQSLVDAGHPINTEDPNGYLPIHYAARAGRLDHLRFLYKKGSKSLNYRAKNGISPLYMAVQHGRLEAVKLLLELGADPNIQTIYGMSPLYSAVHHENEKIAMLLIRHKKTNVDLATEDKKTPLFVAVECQMKEIVQALLKRGANPNTKRLDTYTPLHVAAKNGLTAMCNKLLEAGALVNTQIKSGRTSLHLAAEGHPDTVKLLLSDGANPLLTGWDKATPLMAAIFSGDTLSAERIIRACAQSSTQRKMLSMEDLKGATPLIAALTRRQYGVVELLLNEDIVTPKSPEFQELLCRAKIDPKVVLTLLKEEDGTWNRLEKLCFIAQKHGHNQLVSYLELFHNVKALSISPDEKGWGAIHYAAQHDHIDVVRSFIKEALNLTLMTKDGRSVAAIAAENGSCRTLGLLLNAMEKKKVSLENQFTGMHLLAAAVQAGQQKAADLIIYRILDPNVPLDKNKTRAAHLAVRNNDVEMLTFLRSRGARFDIYDVTPKSPIHAAFDEGWKDTIEYLFDEKHEIDLPKNLLRYAAGRSSAKNIVRLIKKGFKVNNAGPKTNKAALHWAIEKGNYPTFEVLCKNGADLSQKTSDGLTPLMVAAKYGGTEFIISLLSISPARNAQEAVALHLAVEGGHEESVNLLLGAGFKTNVKRSDGKTPLDIAKSKRFFHIQLLLEGKEKELKSQKELVIKNLREGNVARFIFLAKRFPLNHSMIFRLEGKNWRVPLLHLIHELVPDEIQRMQFLQAFSKLPRVKWDVQCSKGRTVDHVIALHGRDSKNFKFNLFAKDNDGNTTLHFYAANASARQLRVSLKNQKKNVDVKDNHGVTPLIIAVHNKKVDSVRVLIDCGANPNQMSNRLITPLIAAVEAGHLETIKLLLERGASINQPCYSAKMTPLLVAISKKQVNIALFIISAGADVNKPDRDGVTPVHMAALKGNLPLLRLLLSTGANLKVTDHKGMTLAHYVAQSDNPEILDFLSGHGVPLDTPNKVRIPSLREKTPPAEGVTPFHLASQKGNEAMMQKFIEKGCNVESLTQREMSALAYVAGSENKQALRLFREYRLMDDSKQRTEAIQMALASDSVLALKEFYKDEAPVDRLLDKRGKTALHYAAFFGAHKCAVFLIRKGARLEIQDLDQKSPLDLAVMRKHLTLVRYFVDCHEKIDLDVDGKDRKPYLHQACEAGAVELAALLIELGSSIEKVDFQGMRPIHIAAKQGNFPLLKHLLAFGAECDARTAEGQSVLQLLPRPEVVSIVRSYRSARVKRSKNKESLIHTAVDLSDEIHLPLLSKIEDINKKDTRGQTPLHKAVLKGNLKMVSLLLDRGASIDVEDSSSLTPLVIAILIKENLFVTDILLKAKANVQVPDKEGSSLLQAITNLSNKDYAKAVFNRVLESIPQKEISKPSERMVDAIKKGNNKAILNLLNEGHPIENKHFSVLHLATKLSAISVMNLLLTWCLTKTMNINYQDSKGVTALHIAVLNKSQKTVSLLSDNDCNLELCEKECGLTPLGFAVKKSFMMTKMLLARGASPYALSNTGETLLHIVADRSKSKGLGSKRRSDIFNAIYSKLDKKHSKSILKEMSQAIEKDDVKQFFVCLNNGHPIENESFSLLSAAALNAAKLIGYIILLNFDPNLEYRDKKSHTPLHLAAIGALKRNFDLFFILLFIYRTNPVIQNNEGTTLLHTLLKIGANTTHSFLGKTLDGADIFSAVYTMIPKKGKDEFKGINFDNEKALFQLVNKGYPLGEYISKLFPTK